MFVLPVLTSSFSNLPNKCFIIESSGPSLELRRTRASQLWQELMKRALQRWTNATNHLKALADDSTNYPVYTTRQRKSRYTH